jgi:hypothetical protein
MADRLGQSPYLNDISNPVASEAYDLERQKRIADMLTQKGMESPQGQIVGGRFVKPGWSQYANQMLSAYLGGKESQDVIKQQQALADKLRQQETSDIGKFIQAGQSTPAQTTYGAGEEGPTMNVTPEQKPDYAKQLSIALGSQSPTVRALGTEMLKQSMTPTKLGEGESLVTRDLFGTGGYTPVAQGGEKNPTEYKEFLKAQQGGFKGSFFDYQTALKRAGAQPINVSVGKDLAGQVGDIMKTSAAAAQGAVQTVQSADKILNAIPGAITGKGAEARLTANQWADTLGVGGKDTQAKLDNTRQIMQETAKLALAAPPRGQGAVSDYERALFAKAAGGDVNLTPTELRLIANRAKEGAQYVVQSHEAKLKAMQANPETASLVPYYSVQTPQQLNPSTNATAAPSAQAAPTMRWNPQTGQLESVK